MRRAKLRREPLIETDRLLLRLIEEDDLDDIVAEINDPGVARMLGRVPHPYGRADAEEYLALARRNAASGQSVYFVMESDGHVIGNIGIGAMPYICEFGYWLGRRHWGKGFATEAGRAVLAFGFERLGIRLVRSGVFADNLTSLRVQMKLGFRRTGESRRHCLARATKVAHIDTVLTPGHFRAATLR